jgi:hypothetical protein
MDSNSKRSDIKLDLSDCGLGGLYSVSLKATYCINPDCNCGGVVLYPARVSGTEVTPWVELAKEIKFILNPQTGEIGAMGPESSLRQTILERLKAKIDRRQRTRLAKKRMEVLRQNCEDGWRYRDWSDFRPGLLMGWADIFPESIAPSIQIAGGIYFLDDSYCCTFGCSCTEVMLTVLSHGENAEICGNVRFDYSSGRATAESPSRLPAKLLLDIVNGMFKQHPTLRAEIRRRGEFMAGPVATFVHESVKVPRSAPPSSCLRSRAVAPPPEVASKSSARPFGRVGRNEACPCGSGQKYKKCCLAS